MNADSFLISMRNTSLKTLKQVLAEQELYWRPLWPKWMVSRATAFQSVRVLIMSDTHVCIHLSTSQVHIGMPGQITGLCVTFPELAWCGLQEWQ